MKRVLLLPFIFALLGVICLGQKSSVPIAGCYADTALIEDESLVIGNGSLIIRKFNKRYVATFTELAGDGGASYPAVAIKRIVVDEPRKTIIFDLPLHSGTILRQVRGQISRRGIKMKWNKNAAGEFGQPSPFMKRKKCAL